MSEHVSGEAKGRRRGSRRRLVVTGLLMAAITFVTFGVAVFLRDVGSIFIAAFVTMVLAILLVSIWFMRFMLTAEKGRD